MSADEMIKAGWTLLAAAGVLAYLLYVIGTWGDPK